jgi:hypothetical protein
MCVVVAPAVWAQQPAAPPSKAPDSTAMAAQLQQFAGAFNQMGPMYETMMRSMLQGTLKALADSENVERLATFIRSYYLALVRHGFTREEALQIVAGFGIPMRPGR